MSKWDAKMANQKQIAITETELSLVLHQMQERLERMEKRLGQIESRISINGAGDQDRAWAKPSAVVGTGAVVSSSISSTPASIVPERKEIMLSPIDEQIVSMIRAGGAVRAEDVRIKFKYRGKNAASSRMNRLWSMGVLEKQQAGREVYYKIKS